MSNSSAARKASTGTTKETTEAQPGKREVPYFEIVIGPKQNQYDHQRALVGVNGEFLSLERGVPIPLERKFVVALFNASYPVWVEDPTAPGGRKRTEMTRHFPFTITRRIFDKKVFDKLVEVARTKQVRPASDQERQDLALDDSGEVEEGFSDSFEE